jgi:hypothetical protein
MSCSDVKAIQVVLTLEKAIFEYSGVKNPRSASWILKLEYCKFCASKSVHVLTAPPDHPPDDIE